MTVLALHEVEVAVANPGGTGADQDFSRTRIVDPYLFYFQGAVNFTQHCSLHRLARKLK